MTAILRQALLARPFEPITIVTVDGASVTIQHPDSAAVLRRAGVLYVELPEEEEPRSIGLGRIKQIRAKNLAPDDEKASGA